MFQAGWVSCLLICDIGQVRVRVRFSFCSYKMGLIIASSLGFSGDYINIKTCKCPPSSLQHSMCLILSIIVAQLRCTVFTYLQVSLCLTGPLKDRNCALFILISRTLNNPLRSDWTLINSSWMNSLTDQCYYSDSHHYTAQLLLEDTLRHVIIKTGRREKAELIPIGLEYCFYGTEGNKLKAHIVH